MLALFFFSPFLLCIVLMVCIRLGKTGRTLRRAMEFRGYVSLCPVAAFLFYLLFLLVPGLFLAWFFVTVTLFMVWFFLFFLTMLEAQERLDDWMDLSYHVLCMRVVFCVWLIRAERLCYLRKRWPAATRFINEKWARLCVDVHEAGIGDLAKNIGYGGFEPYFRTEVQLIDGRNRRRKWDRRAGR
ncbi:hypothetical protein [Corynebacterium lowii]|nr:hypothetical protein [Corynebacterium lowii]MDP9851377.1 hypothetical protein [Corynebacterium lowii]